jgi:hypothetical protein
MMLRCGSGSRAFPPAAIVGYSWWIRIDSVTERGDPEAPEKLLAGL